MWAQSISISYSNRCYPQIIKQFQHVKDSTARMPYSKMLHYGIRMEGLPSAVVLGHEMDLVVETLPFNEIYDVCGGSMFLHVIYQDYVI